MIGVILKKLSTLTEKFLNGFLYANNDRKPSLDPIATFQLDISHLITGVAAP